MKKTQRMKTKESSQIPLSLLSSFILTSAFYILTTGLISLNADSLQETMKRKPATI